MGEERKYELGGDLIRDVPAADSTNQQGIGDE
jgi:hypothetical protein